MPRRPSDTLKGSATKIQSVIEQKSPDSSICQPFITKVRCFGCLFNKLIELLSAQVLAVTIMVSVGSWVMQPSDIVLRRNSAEIEGILP